ncbi:MAG: VOC family protein [bacterium]|nr:VOC family protein [bacterium]
MDIVQKLQLDANAYLDELTTFLSKNNLTDLVLPPVDHFAYKLQDAPSYEQYLEQIAFYATSVKYIKINERRIATIILKDSISFKHLGQTSCLEVMEPRPQKVGIDFVGLEHIEVLCTNQDELAKKLIQRNISYDLFKSPYHEAIVLKINTKGQEISFTNMPLNDVVALEGKSGKIITIK